MDDRNLFFSVSSRVSRYNVASSATRNNNGEKLEIQFRAPLNPIRKVICEILWRTAKRSSQSQFTSSRFEVQTRSREFIFRTRGESLQRRAETRMQQNADCRHVRRSVFIAICGELAKGNAEIRDGSFPSRARDGSEIGEGNIQQLSAN